MVSRPFDLSMNRSRGHRQETHAEQVAVGLNDLDELAGASPEWPSEVPSILAEDCNLIPVSLAGEEVGHRFKGSGPDAGKPARFPGSGS